MRKIKVQQYADIHKRIVKRVESFAEEMKRKGIHVGIGQPPICVTCEKPWEQCEGRK